MIFRLFKNGEEVSFCNVDTPQEALETLVDPFDLSAPESMEPTKYGFKGTSQGVLWEIKGGIKMAWRKIQRKGTKKKGYGFYVIIPAEIMKEFNLKKGDTLNFQTHKDQNYIHVGIVPPNEAGIK